MTGFLDSLMAVGTQVVVLFVLIGVGAVTRFTKILNDESVRGCTSLLLTFVTACLLIASFQRECTPEQLGMVGTSAVIGFVFHGISIALAYLFLHDADKSRDAVLKFSVVFTNAGFMSIPLQEAVLGADGVFCGAVIVGIFQLLCWTFGLWLMSGDRRILSLRKVVVNPGIIGIATALALFLLGVKLPEVVLSPCRHMGNLNTPLAMIVIGYHLAGARFGGILHDAKGLFAMALRLVVSPLLLVLLMRLCGVGNHTVLVATVIAASAPVAAITTMFSVQYGRDVRLSVELVSLSTLVSVVTMPLVVALAEVFVP